MIGPYLQSYCNCNKQDQIDVVMHKNEAKLQSLIKKIKFRTTFQLCVYLHEFKSISLSKQGNYYITATLCPKSALFRQSNNCVSDNTFSKTSSSRVFNIKYNNHTEILNECYNFSFYFEENGLGAHSEQGNKLLLVFQLMRCRNQSSEEPERKLAEQYQSVASFSFQIKTHENLTFVEYFNISFEMPFSAQISGIGTCLMTNFQTTENQNLINSESALMPDKRAEKLKNYFSLVSYLKKLAKKHRFSSFSSQKLLQQVFLGFHSTLTIPTNPSLKKSISEQQYEQSRLDISLITQSNINNDTFYKQNYQHNSYKQSPQRLPTEMPQISVSDFDQKIKKHNQRQCNQEQFMSYLAFVQFQDRKIQELLNQIKSIGSRNRDVIKQVCECVFPKNSIKQKQPHNGLSHKVIMQTIFAHHKQKRNIIYLQKLTFFGQSLPSASVQMKAHMKTMSSLRSKQKQNFYTKMNQLFSLVPEYDCQYASLRYDACPYVAYSWAINGRDNQEDDSDDCWDQGVQTKDKVQIKTEKKKKKSKEQFRNVFLLAHGYQASSGNMQKLKISFKKLFPRSKFFVLKSYSQHMDHGLEQMGKKAAKQIQSYLLQATQNTNKKIRIIMVGHSMGGIILRSCLQHLPQQMTKCLHTFISFATPHLGYLNCKNFITETGIKLIQSMHPSTSLKQLSNKDNVDIKQTFIYKLASIGSLKNFQNVVVLSSLEDKYVPWNSARIQLYKKAEGIGGKSTTGGWSMSSTKQYMRFVEQEMIKQILGLGQPDSKIKNLHRFQVDFMISHVDLDTMIGRTAHVAFLANQHMLPIVFECCLDKTLYNQLKNS